MIGHGGFGTCYRTLAANKKLLFSRYVQRKCSYLKYSRKQLDSFRNNHSVYLNSFRPLLDLVMP
jgi:hypothetical protein